MTRTLSRIRGVIAALLLPRNGDDEPLWGAFEQNARFLVEAGVSGLCVNGATGEYSGATAAERREAILRARLIAGENRVVVSGAGATRSAETLQLVREAGKAGADAVLVPAPHFFKYSQSDLAEFYRRIAAASPLPVLIYNLPAFTGGLEPRVAAELIRGQERIAGVKDSGGELELLSLLANGPAIRLVGNDNVLAEALERGLCDGTVSGVAGVLPELTLELWRSAATRDWDRFHDLAHRQNALLARLEEFPAPWGLKFVAETRGLAPAATALPLSEERQRQAEEFETWFRAWWASAAETLGGTLAAA